MNNRKDLTVEQLRYMLSYSPMSGEFYWINPPRCHSELKGKLAGAIQTNTSGKCYHSIKINGLHHKRSRIAFLFMTGEHPEYQIDHINGDSLDDRWCNLRQVTVTENAWNHKKRKKPNSHLPMGVSTTQNGKYRARISVNKNHICLGVFSTPEDAYSVYIKARKEHYGQFSGL